MKSFAEITILRRPNKNSPVLQQILKNVALLTECSQHPGGAGYLLYCFIVRKLLKSDWDVASYFFQSVRICFIQFYLLNFPTNKIHKVLNQGNADAKERA